MLTVALGCDKQPKAAPKEPPTSLAGTPPMLFLMFGERGDPRLLPVASLAGGRIVPIVLDDSTWRDFDRAYFAPGRTLSLYRGGGAFGEATIRRGMWSDTTPLYRLPGCRSLRPLAAVSIARMQDAPVMLELLATSAPLALPPPRPATTPEVLDSARAVASHVAQREGLTKNARAELDLAVQAFQTGASGRPTLLASYMERGGGIGGHPRHVFILADSSAAGYAPSFIHAATDSTADFRRMIDHVDLTGDGVDEVVLEGWRAGRESYLLVMQYGGGRWRELMRSATSWCADAP